MTDIQRFWIRWIAASGFGWFLAITVGMTIAWGLTAALVSVDYTLSWLTGILVGAAIAGAAIGAMQWLVLWSDVSRAGKWVSLSSAGAVLGVIVAGSLGFPVVEVRDFGIGFNIPPGVWNIAVSYTLGGPFAGAVVGAGMGIMQWTVLRLHVSRAGWWVLASTIGSAAGFAVGSIVSYPLRQDLFMVAISTGVIASAVAGIVLTIRLRHSVSEL